MNAFLVLGFIAGILYGIFIDGTFFKIYFALIMFYFVVFNNLLINKKDYTKRKNILATTWNGMTSLF